MMGGDQFPPIDPVELARITGDWEAIGRAPPTRAQEVASFAAESVIREPTLFILAMGFVLAMVML